jgi:O-antigen/teichoic acid export membrane protein
VHVARAFLQTFSIQVGQTALSVASGVLIARALGPAGQGDYATVATVIAIGSLVATLGQFQGNVLAAAAQGARPRILLARSLIQCIALAVVTSIAALLIGADGVPRPIALLAAAVLSLEVLGQLVRGINLGQHHVLTFNLASLIQRLVLFAGVATLFLARGVSVSAVLQTWLAALIVSILASTVPLWRRSKPEEFRLAGLLHGWRSSLRFGGRAFVALSLTLLLVRADVWMLRPWLGAVAVGQISVASGLAEWLWYVPTIVGNLLFAAVAADRSRDSVDKVCRASRLVVMGTVPLAVGLLLFGSHIVQLLYGPSYAVAGEVFRLLVPGMMAIAVHLVIDSYFAGIGFPPLSIVIAGGALVVKLLFNLLLVPRFGVYGAATATSIAYVGMLASKIVWFSRRTGMPIRSQTIARQADLSRALGGVKEWIARRARVEVTPPATVPADL